ncbi:MAG: 1-deoxy-D-xylulose-5-phosphate reductoisomerase [Lentisphaeria bacterium]|nr:1-deoxy-D-xylulose-5-phosphate reductoisomerase [Lentisphaeria bacterium]
MIKKKRIAILGSTGSVGVNACRVAEALRDRVEVTALAAGSNAELLAAQAAKFHCKHVSLRDSSRKDQLLRDLPAGCKASFGEESLTDLVCAEDVDMVLCAIVGTGGLKPVIEAIRCGKEIALASKEVLVMAGQPVMDLVRQTKIPFIPVDSEHSAIFQCLTSLDSRKAENLILTSSGGPFRKATWEEMQQATFEKALAHPVWSMGQKITIDSATLMNKALEMVEAHFLFDCPEEKIRVLVHPQSIIHSMVEFPDGVTLAQLSVPDMRFPIQYAFTYPERHPGGLQKLDLATIGHLDFENPDTKRFPSLGFARHAIREGGVLPCVMNAANEIAYSRFKKGEIGFTDIFRVIEKTMDQVENKRDANLAEILDADSIARKIAADIP